MRGGWRICGGRLSRRGGGAVGVRWATWVNLKSDESRRGLSKPFLLLKGAGKVVLYLLAVKIVSVHFRTCGVVSLRGSLRLVAGEAGDMQVHVLCGDMR